jgi:hypothetical protein
MITHGVSEGLSIPGFDHIHQFYPFFVIKSEKGLKIINATCFGSFLTEI